METTKKIISKYFNLETKPIKVTILITMLIASFIGCKKDFLDLKPKDQLTVETTFTTYDNIKAYSWQFYEVFPAYDNPQYAIGAAHRPQDDEVNSDLFSRSVAGATSDWIWQRITVPSSSTDYTVPFSNIRAINIMLDNLDAAKLSDADKKHWKSVGFFFKAYNYANLVNKYGDITWVEHSLADSDTEVLYGSRTPRNEVAQKILDMLTFAESNIKPAGDGANTINVNVVRALLSRFGLMEGTWRKYHNLSDAQKYLQASSDASAKLIIAFPDLNPNYNEEFDSESLAGMKGILLYKQYENAQLTHTMQTFFRSSSSRYDMTKKAADMYLMKDGQTRWTSPLFQGDQSPYTEFRNRDKRLYYTIPPPFRVVLGTPNTTFTYTTNTADREYIDLMATISPNGQKTLPTLQWQGQVVKAEPHFNDFQDGQPFSITNTGYRFAKMSGKSNTGFSSVDVTDAPIFRMSEVFLNYAEAQFELGTLTQIVVDKTINKLRARGGVANLNLSGIPNDPTRDPSIVSELWEIRRERAVELMGDGFRFDDLRRWKKMDYALAQKLGRWIVKANYGGASSKIPILNNAAAGYISYEALPPQSFPDYYYLYPIPSNQIVLSNGAIKQNTGWN